MRAPACACQRGLRVSWRECERGHGHHRGSLGPAAWERGSDPRDASGSRLRAQRRREGSVWALCPHRPLPPSFSRAHKGCRTPSTQLWTGRSGTSRMGAAAEWNAGLPATKAPRRGGERTRGEGGVPAPAEASRGPAGRPFPLSAAWAQLPGLQGSGSSGDRNALGRGARAHALWLASAPSSRGPCAPPPAHDRRPSRGTSSPQPAARGQTRPRAEEPRGREGRKKEVASPRQGILNYRLKASKTVHHIFHVSAGGRDKRKQNAEGGKGPFSFFFFSSLFYYLCECKMH